jgi:hypothetical protein
MKQYYDPSKWFRNPAIAKNIIENGYTVTVYEDETETKIVEQYFVSPEEVAERVAAREANRKIRQTAIEDDIVIHQV